MTDKLMNDEYVKSKAPMWIIAFCAGFMMLIQTLASGLAVIGYDDVIRAGAKAKEAEILQREQMPPEFQARLDLLEQQVRELILDSEVLKENSHAPGG